MKTRTVLATIAGSVVALAIIIGLLMWGGGSEETPTNDRNAAVAPPDAPTSDAAAAAPAEAEHAEAFKKFVMIDRESEPEWMSRVTRVRFNQAGLLIAETTYPADWRDTSTRSRPAESICSQLFAYVQRGVRRPWHGVTVLAADGTALVTRPDFNGSCRQL